MEVKIAFDTEKESVHELKQLLTFVQELITKRESGAPAMTPTQAQIVINKSSNPVTHAPQPQKEGKTSAGGKIIPYEDMSLTMSKLYSGGL